MAAHPSSKGMVEDLQDVLQGMRTNGSALNVHDAGRTSAVYPGRVPARLLRCPLLPLWVTFHSHLWLEGAERITSGSHAVKRTLPYFWGEWTITACPKQPCFKRCPWAVMTVSLSLSEASQF